jgi:hypothetical protein
MADEQHLKVTYTVTPTDLMRAIHWHYLHDPSARIRLWGCYAAWMIATAHIFATADRWYAAGYCLL